MVYSSVYFVVGGLIYLNREKMKQFVKRKKLLSIPLIFFTLLLYFNIGENTVTMVLAADCSFLLHWDVERWEYSATNLLNSPAVSILKCTFAIW